MANIDELIIYWNQYKQSCGPYNATFEGFMRWLESRYWNMQTVPPKKDKP